jgi:EAL domain-containing protein (putative c-di-GMP-specific phosphodiesterase class I)
MDPTDEALEPLLPEPGIASIGEAIPTIAERFAASGSVGMMLVDAGDLSRIEELYGRRAWSQAFESLTRTLENVIATRLAPRDMLVSGEVGRDEVVVLFFREPHDAAFFQQELPAYRVEVREAIEKRGRQIAHPYLRQPLRAPVGLSMAFCNPTIGTGTQLRRLLENARGDSELYSRLEARRNRESLTDILLKRRIRSVYEPIVEVKSRTVFGYEALARGPRDNPLHSPLALFAVAEEEGLLFPLDCLCRKSGLVGAKGLPEGTHLFLNVRPTAIHDPDFRSAALRKTLEVCGLAPNDVVLEISEQESIENFEIFREIRDYYRKLGFRIALDDTGAGYASLEAVVELAPDFIKVDRAFVRGVDEDPSRQELLHALQKVACSLGSEIIAEGLDTLEELATLGKLGIRYGQGWLFGHPNPLRSDLNEP